MNIKIRQRSKHCEARCRFTLNGKKKEVTIPLKTSRPKVIAQRVQEIQSKSEFIKDHIQHFYISRVYYQCSCRYKCWFASTRFRKCTDVQMR